MRTFKLNSIIGLCSVLLLFANLIACDNPKSTNNPTSTDESLTIEQMNIADFGVGITPTVYNCNSSNLIDTLDSITTAGDYVVNVTGDVNIGTLTDQFQYGSGITISIRGNGGSIIGQGFNGRQFDVNDGAKLVLRNITLNGNGQGGNEMLYVKGTLVMESGSAITGANNMAVGVWCGNFIMNGGEIYGNSAKLSNSIITVRMENSHFIKKQSPLVWHAVISLQKRCF